MKATSIRVMLMAGGDYCILMGRYMRESGNMMKHMDMGYMCMGMEPPMRDSGNMICNRAREQRNGQMEGTITIKP